MKVCAFQPQYPYEPGKMDKLVEWLESSLDSCDDSFDLIVLPEACNGMSNFDALNDFQTSIKMYGERLSRKAQKTAERCKALVAINLYVGEEGVYRNTTQVYDKYGNLAGEYLKQHLPESEVKEKKIDDSYAHEYQSPYTIDVDGVRYGFLTCYDCYYTEYIQHISKQKPDVLIVCSLQRGERMDMLETQMKNAAFNCNAYVVRSSVSMGGEDCKYGGSSMIVSPNGEVIAAMGQKTGLLCSEIDPKVKHSRPDTFGHPDILNDIFIEKGRTPWAYRASGASVRLGDADMPYPRICSHRGFNTVAPENTMPAFGAAVALGAEEIELDLWPSKDGKLVVIHDESVDRVSNGNGKVTSMDWSDIHSLDAGIKFSEEFSGLQFPTLDDVLQKFSRQVIVNIHINSSADTDEYDHDVFKQIVSSIYKYYMQNHVDITGEEDVLRTPCKIATELPRAALDGKFDKPLV
ncbi:MAG: glycerophosphodiester phosphodiesterase family protein, partial [Clostridia bacterium]|nr:glycerophosphodiester phosphodiesterase family protein [Clostridia bacterium]